MNNLESQIIGLFIWIKLDLLLNKDLLSIYYVQDSAEVSIVKRSECYESIESWVLRGKGRVSQDFLEETTLEFS